MVWQQTQATEQRHTYQIGTVFSSRHWLHVHGTLGSSGSGGGGTGSAPQFDAFAPAVDIDVVPALVVPGEDPEVTEEEAAGVIVPGGSLVTINLIRKFAVTNVQLEATAGASRIKLYRNPDKTGLVTLPLTISEANLVLYAEYLLPPANTSQSLEKVSEACGSLIKAPLGHTA